MTELSTTIVMTEAVEIVFLPLPIDIRIEVVSAITIVIVCTYRGAGGEEGTPFCK